MAYVPQIKGLRVNQILEEARKHVDVDQYMPDLKDDKLPNREYVINVSKTLIWYFWSKYINPWPVAINGWKSKVWEWRKVYWKERLEHESTARIPQDLFRNKRGIK